MNRSLILLCSSLGLAACGGSGGSSNNPEPTNAYLEYMKTSYSEYVGEESTDNDERYTRTNFSAEAIPLATTTTTADSTSSAEFTASSQTNVQVVGVDEASAVKFDGAHLLVKAQSNSYANAESNNTSIVKNIHSDTLEGLSNEDTTLHFSPDPSYRYQGLLRSGGYAALIGYKSSWYPYANTVDIAFTSFCYDCGISEPEIIVYTWQYAQDRVGLPPQTQQVEIEGSFNNVRLIGSKLYLVSRFSPRLDGLELYPTTDQAIQENQALIDSLEIEDVSPEITIDNQTESLISSECELPESDNNYRRFPQVLSVTQIDIEDTTDWQSACVVGDISGAFFSLENIYFTRWKWNDNETEILKFSTSENDGVVFEASGSVAGSVSYDSYYFGEVDGHLVYVNTIYDNETWWNFDGRHQLSVFEQNGDSLDVTAQIPNENAPSPIGKPGERIYAVRIIDERAYIVTFDKVDPLYVIDLSDISSPQILGELEIPGFSSYIHPINNNLLIGVGKNAETFEGTTWFQGLNIRLFDVSDPTQPIALQSLDYGLRGSDTPVTYDPHSFTFAFDEENQLFRFAVPMRLHGDEQSFDPDAHPNTYYPWQESGLFQFEVSTGAIPEIQEAGRYLFGDEGNIYYNSNVYSVINNDSVYMIKNESIDVIEWGGDTALRSFELIAQ